MLTASELLTLRAARIILASSSPRRVEILNHILKAEAEVVPSTFPEDLDKGRFTPEAYVQENAMQKADEVRARVPGRSVVVGADTVVVHKGRILEKPADAAAAAAMLGGLSGSSHSVCTGVALIYADGTRHQFVETTTVNFASLSAECIQGYVETGEPMDKAGGYGIQGFGGAFVSGIEGDYFNVVGFPMHRFCRELDVARLEAFSAAS